MSAQRTVLLAQLARLEHLLESARLEMPFSPVRSADSLAKAIELLNTIADGV
jgi:hypothetical protein